MICRSLAGAHAEKPESSTSTSLLIDAVSPACTRSTTTPRWRAPACRAAASLLFPPPPIRTRPPSRNPPDPHHPAPDFARKLREFLNHRPVILGVAPHATEIGRRMGQLAHHFYGFGSPSLQIDLDRYLLHPPTDVKSSLQLVFALIATTSRGVFDSSTSSCWKAWSCRKPVAA